MTDAQTATPTVDQLRTELEQTRAAYHELANSLAPEDFRKKSGNPAWTIGQMMWHMAWGIQYTTASAAALRGKKQFAPPRGLFDLVNPWITRWGARHATPDSVTKMYDESHAKVLASLETLTDEDLAKTVKPLYEEETVAYGFQMPTRHLAEHRPEVLKGIGRE
jgi:hypothetical protein